jgi:hypothetical protein
MWINLGCDNHISKVAWGGGSIYDLITIILSNHNLVTCAHVIITPFKSKEISNYVALTLTKNQLTKLVKRKSKYTFKKWLFYIFQAPSIGKFNILIIE